jgi:sugar-specific transcriptional regulator TrmB
VSDPVPGADGETDAGADADADADAARGLLSDLGLSTYEAAVFVALQRLGVATASELEAASGVPRSQVYGAAEGLSERGLIHTQGTTPRRYRPVDVDVARERLWEPFRRRSERAFETLAALSRRPEPEPGPGGGERGDVWLVEGVPATSARVEELLAAAERSALYAVGHPALVSDSLVEALDAAVDAGVDARVLSRDADLLDRFVGTGARLGRVPATEVAAGVVGRVLVVDDDAVLVSAYGGGETAVWSVSSDVATVLAEIVESAVEGVRS